MADSDVTSGPTKGQGDVVQFDLYLESLRDKVAREEQELDKTREQTEIINEETELVRERIFALKLSEARKKGYWTLLWEIVDFVVDDLMGLPCKDVTKDSMLYYFCRAIKLSVIPTLVYAIMKAGFYGDKTKGEVSRFMERNRNFRDSYIKELFTWSDTILYDINECRNDPDSWIFAAQVAGSTVGLEDVVKVLDKPLKMLEITKTAASNALGIVYNLGSGGFLTQESQSAMKQIALETEEIDNVIFEEAIAKFRGLVLPAVKPFGTDIVTFLTEIGPVNETDFLDVIGFGENVTDETLKQVATLNVRQFIEERDPDEPAYQRLKTLLAAPGQLALQRNIWPPSRFLTDVSVVFGEISREFPISRVCFVQLSKDTNDSARALRNLEVRLADEHWQQLALSFTGTYNMDTSKMSSEDILQALIEAKEMPSLGKAQIEGKWSEFSYQRLGGGKSRLLGGPVEMRQVEEKLDYVGMATTVIMLFVMIRAVYFLIKRVFSSREYVETESRASTKRSKRIQGGRTSAVFAAFHKAASDFVNMDMPDITDVHAVHAYIAAAAAIYSGFKDEVIAALSQDQFPPTWGEGFELGMNEDTGRYDAFDSPLRIRQFSIRPAFHLYMETVGIAVDYAGVINPGDKPIVTVEKPAETVTTKWVYLKHENDKRESSIVIAKIVQELAKMRRYTDLSVNTLVLNGTLITRDFFKQLGREDEDKDVPPLFPMMEEYGGPRVGYMNNIHALIARGCQLDTRLGGLMIASAHAIAQSHSEDTNDYSITLDISENDFSRIETEDRFKGPLLEFMNLDVKLPTPVKPTPLFVHIALAKCNLGTRGVSVVLEAAMVSNTLRTLDLSDNYSQPCEGVNGRLAHLIQNSPSLHRLVFDKNPLIPDPYDRDNAALLVLEEDEDAVLRALYSAQTEKANKYIKAIADAIKSVGDPQSKSELAYIHFIGIQFNLPALDMFAQALARNATIQQFYFSDAPIDIVGPENKRQDRFAYMDLQRFIRASRTGYTEAREEAWERQRREGREQVYGIIPFEDPDVPAPEAPELQLRDIRGDAMAFYNTIRARHEDIFGYMNSFQRLDPGITYAERLQLESGELMRRQRTRQEPQQVVVPESPIDISDTSTPESLLDPSDIATPESPLDIEDIASSSRPLTPLDVEDIPTPEPSLGLEPPEDIFRQRDRPGTRRETTIRELQETSKTAHGQEEFAEAQRQLKEYGARYDPMFVDTPEGTDIDEDEDDDDDDAGAREFEEQQARKKRRGESGATRTLLQYTNASFGDAPHIILSDTNSRFSEKYTNLTLDRWDSYVGADSVTLHHNDERRYNLLSKYMDVLEEISILGPQ